MYASPPIASSYSTSGRSWVVLSAMSLPTSSGEPPPTRHDDVGAVRRGTRRRRRRRSSRDRVRVDAIEDRAPECPPPRATLRDPLGDPRLHDAGVADDERALSALRAERDRRASASAPLPKTTVVGKLQVTMDIGSPARGLGRCSNRARCAMDIRPRLLWSLDPFVSLGEAQVEDSREAHPRPPRCGTELAVVQSAKR